jgi:hypothetical protein
MSTRDAPVCCFILVWSDRATSPIGNAIRAFSVAIKTLRTDLSRFFSLGRGERITISGDDFSLHESLSEEHQNEESSIFARDGIVSNLSRDCVLEHFHH